MTAEWKDALAADMDLCWVPPAIQLDGLANVTDVLVNLLCSDLVEVHIFVTVMFLLDNIIISKWNGSGYRFPYSFSNVVNLIKG